MKGDYRRQMLDYLAELFMDGMAAKVAVIRALRPYEALPDIKTVYINEEDYDKVVLTPCILLFAYGPEVMEGMTGGYLYEFPIDICAFDNPTADGLPALHNRLYAYQGCLTDLLLSDNSYVEGLWEGVRPLAAADPSNLADERFGALGRVEGYRFGFQMPISY